MEAKMFFHTIAGVLLAAIAVGGAAQDYPTRPIRMVIPFPPGGGADIAGRIVGQKLTERLGVQVVIDNRPGASTLIATEITAKAPGDGYTLLMAAGSHAINPALYGKLPYDAVRDFAPVTLVGSAPQLLIAPAALPANSVRELIALAAGKPGELRYASGGNGSPSHLAMELFKSMAKVDMVHVPYKGGDPVLVALLSGEVHLYFGNIRATMPHVRSGKLKALAVSSPKRSPAAQEVPTIAETGLPGYSMMAWWGLLAPAATPRTIVERLHHEVARQLGEPALRDRLAAVGIDTVGSSPDAFGAYIRQEIATWTKVVKTAGIRID
jgi:tripartite-type tricarboxylate transporter receptor subunit TctC